MTKPTGAFAVFFKKVSQKKRTMYNGRERRKVHIRNGRNSFETYRYVKQKDPIAVYVTKAATSSSALHCTALHITSTLTTDTVCPAIEPRCFKAAQHPQTSMCLMGTQWARGGAVS